MCPAGNNIVELSDQEQDSSQEKNSPAQQPQPELEYREGTANITDYSPEWAYPEVTLTVTSSPQSTVFK